MKMAMWLDYKPTRYEGKGFLRNLNIRIHRDITGEMWFGVDKDRHGGLNRLSNGQVYPTYCLAGRPDSLLGGTLYFF